MQNSHFCIPGCIQLTNYFPFLDHNKRICLEGGEIKQNFWLETDVHAKPVFLCVLFPGEQVVELYLRTLLFKCCSCCVLTIECERISQYNIISFLVLFVYAAAACTVGQLCLGPNSICVSVQGGAGACSCDAGFVRGVVEGQDACVARECCSVLVKVVLKGF